MRRLLEALRLNHLQYYQPNIFFYFRPLFLIWYRNRKEKKTHAGRAAFEKKWRGSDIFQIFFLLHILFFKYSFFNVFYFSNILSLTYSIFQIFFLLHILFFKYSFKMVDIAFALFKSMQATRLEMRRLKNPLNPARKFCLNPLGN